MARKARERSSMGTYNVLLRGAVNLFKDDEDYEHFLELMDKYISALYGFSLMENMVCIVLGESEKGVSMDLKPLITSYARYYNKKYGLEGKLFYGRFKSEPIESEEALVNSAVIASKIPDLMGVEGYVSENENDDFEMIAFYSFAEGQKPKKVKKSPAKKPAPKKEKKAEPKKEAPKKQVEEPKKEEKKKKKNLPSWLL